MTIIKINQLTKEFKHQNEKFLAVDNVSFQLESGKIVALLGPNGAGKTTIVQMVAGYLNPTAGSVSIDDTLLTRKIRKKSAMGVVFGGELGFYGNATAQENLRFFANLKKVPRKQLTQEVYRVLELVELLEVKDKNVGEFSRGMRQRLHIARALLNRPKIILLDEPTTGIDVEMSFKIRELIKNLAKSEDLAVLLTSHMMSEIEFLADSLLLISAGKIYHAGTVDSVIELSRIEQTDRPATLENAYLMLAEKLKRRE